MSTSTITIENSSNEIKELTHDDVKLYDRQIRLWGMDAQKSIQSASILLLEIDALTTDLAKNLCLAGVAKLTIASNAITRVEDLGSEFFLTPESIGKPKLQYYVDRLRLLNPRVQIVGVEVESDYFTQKVLKEYHAVCCVSSNVNTILRINKECSQLKIKFWGASLLGLHGYIFSDLGSHTFTHNKNGAVETGCVEYRPFNLVNLRCPWQGLSKRKMQKCCGVFLVFSFFKYQEKYNKPPSEGDIDQLNVFVREYAELTGFDHQFISPEAQSQFFKLYECKFAAIGAIIGGVLAQEVLRAISGKEKPMLNLYVFDGTSDALYDV